jgi:hypothetical protein
VAKHRWGIAVTYRLTEADAEKAALGSATVPLDETNRHELLGPGCFGCGQPYPGTSSHCRRRPVNLFEALRAWRDKGRDRRRIRRVRRTA